VADVFTLDASEIVDFGRDLSRRGPAIVRKHVEPTLSDAAERMRDDAKRRAPRVTGSLVDSIAVSHSGAEVMVSVGVPYAVAVEFGAKGGQRSKGRGKSKGQPYMLPAFYEDLSNFDNDLEKAADAAVAQMARV